MNNSKIIWSAVAVLAVVAFGFAGWQHYGPVPATDTTPPPANTGTKNDISTRQALAGELSADPNQLEPDTLISATRAADNIEQVNEVITKVLENPQDYSPEQVRTARYNSASLYVESGVQEDLLTSINALKENFLDETASDRRRANSAYKLLYFYCGYGRDDATIREVFRGEPFERFWVDGDPRGSAMRAMKWLYEDFHRTPLAAMQMAKGASGRLITEPDLTPAEREEVIATTKSFLAEGDRLLNRRLLTSDNYPESTQYASDMYWRAFNIMVLDQAGEPEFAGAGDVAYEALFEVINGQSGENAHSGRYLPFAYVLQAYFAHEAGADRAEVAEHLGRAIEYVENDPLTERNHLVEFIYDSRNHEEGGPVLYAIRQMAEVDDEFGSFVSAAESGQRI